METRRKKIEGAAGIWSLTIFPDEGGWLFWRVSSWLDGRRGSQLSEAPI